MAKRVFCIIPAYNEEDNISSIIQSVGKYVDEVVVVDDGSDDRTARIAEEEKAIVLRHVINRGQGAALETGNQYARKKQADVVVHFDADGQFKPDEIDKVVISSSVFLKEWVFTYAFELTEKKKYYDIKNQK